MWDELEDQLVPSQFLPHLPRSQASFGPLLPDTLLGHIGVLRELYIPPIHGGLRSSDTTYAEDADLKQQKRTRRFSAGLNETMDGLGLGLEISPSALAASPILEETSGTGDSDGETDVFEEDEEGDGAHLDPFEREWSEQWLSGVIRRAQGWLEENGEDAGDGTAADMEALLRDATAVLALLAGTSAAGSFTRHLLFPVHPSLAGAIRSVRLDPSDPQFSPETSTFIRSLATSPTSPVTLRRNHAPHSPSAAFSVSPDRGRGRRPSAISSSERSTSPQTAFAFRQKARRKPAIPVLLHDAPMNDHLSVGVQTWGSAILLGREMALRPSEFGLFPHRSIPGGTRVLELGAGTGLLSILCRKLLNLQQATAEAVAPVDKHGADSGIVVATDFLPEVLQNSKVCVDLNFPLLPASTGLTRDPGIRLAKLDWATFPQSFSMPGADIAADDRDIVSLTRDPFDLVLASDCVYDSTHARLLREVVRWVLRLPEGADPGGTFHILSPLRPTFGPELESIDEHFPLLSSYPALSDRQKALNDTSLLSPDLLGEGLGTSRGLKIGVRGSGKRSRKGKKGEGRVDEVEGYWWWEVGWG